MNKHTIWYLMVLIYKSYFLRKFIDRALASSCVKRDVISNAVHESAFSRFTNWKGKERNKRKFEARVLFSVNYYTLESPKSLSYLESAKALCVQNDRCGTHSVWSFFSRVEETSPRRNCGFNWNQTREIRYGR